MLLHICPWFTSDSFLCVIWDKAQVHFSPWGDLAVWAPRGGKALLSPPRSFGSLVEGRLTRVCGEGSVSRLWSTLISGPHSGSCSLVPSPGGPRLSHLWPLLVLPRRQHSGDSCRGCTWPCSDAQGTCVCRFSFRILLLVPSRFSCICLDAAFTSRWSSELTGLPPARLPFPSVWPRKPSEAENRNARAPAFLWGTLQKVFWGPEKKNYIMETILQPPAQPFISIIISFKMWVKHINHILKESILVPQKSPCVLTT